MGRRGPPTFALLGAILGLGYLVKAPIFPLAFVFLGVAFWSAGRTRGVVAGLLIGLVTFTILAGPFVVALSIARGRFTFGDTAKVNYAWNVNHNGEFFHWQGGDPRAGKPLHATRKILAWPAVYEFRTPIAGTYPPHYDFTYWNDGLKPYFSLRDQIKGLVRNTYSLYYIFFFLQSGLVAGVLILFLMDPRGWRCLADIAANWHLLALGSAVVGMYALIRAEPRYVGAFVVILWVSLMAAIRVADSPNGKRLAVSVVFAVTLTLMLPILDPMVLGLRNRQGLYPTEPIHWSVAQGLQRMGVRPGDTVACIGYGYDAYWARLAQAKVVTEVPDFNSFWIADSQARADVIKTLGQAGAKVVVARDVPPTARESDWQRIEGTNYSMLALKANGQHN